MRGRRLLHRKMSISKSIIGADGLRICWAHKNNTLGGAHAATSQISFGFVYPNRGFVGRFAAENAGTLVIDTKRKGHFFSLGHPEWESTFPY